MSARRLSLGLDLSTQSLSAMVLDIQARTRLAEHSLDYAKDARLNVFGIRPDDYILPPRTEGEADQPAAMYLAALDAMLSDLSRNVPLREVRVINVSGQQHGHVYLNKQAVASFTQLRYEKTESQDLATLLACSFAYDRAPIWMTSNTLAEAAFVRGGVSGKERLIKLSGSDAQLRFTGIVVRHVARQNPEVYASAQTIQLISSFIPAVLSANPLVPTDFGNACGTSLLDYRLKRWSAPLVDAVSRGLPGGRRALRRKLTAVVAPDSIVGRIAPYFVRKYGFSPDCRIAAGSGDNPQSKVLIGGDLLSLGSSFVNMISTDGKVRDMTGDACAMYDGIGRPFLFGCRTNGTLVWDRVRALYGMEKDDYISAEAALESSPIGQGLVFWQPRDESFPASGSFDLARMETTAGLETDYAGIVESGLAAVYLHSESFAAPTGSPLYVMGGATNSPGVVRRVAAIWGRPVVVTGKTGAALGAAVAGVSALLKSEGAGFDADEYSATLVQRSEPVGPFPEDTAALHRPGGYMERFAQAEERLLREHPLL